MASGHHCHPAENEGAVAADTSCTFSRYEQVKRRTCARGEHLRSLETAWTQARRRMKVEECTDRVAGVYPWSVQVCVTGRRPMWHWRKCRPRVRARAREDETRLVSEGVWGSVDEDAETHDWSSARLLDHAEAQSLRLQSTSRNACYSALRCVRIRTQNQPRKGTAKEQASWRQRESGNKSQRGGMPIAMNVQSGAPLFPLICARAHQN